MENDLNIALQHFWGSSYWTTILQQAPELSSDTVKVLLAKSQEIDLLRAQLMRLQAKMQEPAPAQPQPDAPETFRVGDRVEADWARRNWSETKEAPDWRMCEIREIAASHINAYWVVFDCSLSDKYRMKPSEIRRPVAPEPERFKFGQRVKAWESDAIILGVAPDKDGDVKVWIDGAETWCYAPLAKVFPL